MPLCAPPPLVPLRRLFPAAALSVLATSVAFSAAPSPSRGPLREPRDSASPTSPPTSASAPLAFSITEGAVENHFYRRGPVAAHLVASSGATPRLLVAFPAGNTGVAVWFEPPAAPAHLGLAPGTALAGFERDDGLRGITAHLRSSARTLTIRHTLLANIRTIRDAIAAGFSSVPAEFAGRVDPGPPLVFHRTTVDGHHHVELRLEPEHGTTLVADGAAIRLSAGPSGTIDFALAALADDPPLTPFARDALFNSAVADRPRDQEVFAFLASAEKFTAGSWRFLTYFGRDTLLSVQLLLPVLQPPVVEAALGSILERLSPAGEVAHEEAIGEFAVLENRQKHPPPADLTAPVLDYKMIDGEFLLAPAVAAYLLDTPGGAAHAAAFLARRTSRGDTYADQLRRNLALVLERTAAFTERPLPQNLIALKPGLPVGNWRDSEHGLGGGRYPFDVNVALAPAALDATARLYRSGLLGGADDASLAARAQRAADAWRPTERFFRLTVPPNAARTEVAAYARSLRLDPTAAIASIDGPVVYDALALDADGRPVPVMNTDSGFVLFFTRPPADTLDAIARQLSRPFPAGLRTAVGLVVANPVFGGESRWREFTRADYHGTVVWSWQQALMAAGLRRQLARADLPAATRTRLAEAERLLWERITALQAQSSGELWTWEPREGREALLPFGQAAGHADESNAAQLWSTVYLAVQPPR